MPSIECEIRDLEISDEDANRLLDALDESQEGCKHSDRTSPRHFLRGTAFVRIVRDDHEPAAAHLVRIRNISRTGVAFLSPTAIEASMRLTIELPIGPNLSIVSKEAIARHSRDVSSGIVEIGAEFI